MYIKNKYSTGFTIIEVMVSIVIIGILIFIGSSGLSSLNKEFRFKDYTSKVEYQAKYARIVAIQKSTYTGVCIENKTLTLKDLGSYSISDSSKMCDNTLFPNVIKKIDLSLDKNINITGYPYIFDARGIAAKTGVICLYDDSRGVEFDINIAGLKRKIVAKETAKTCS